MYNGSIPWLIFEGDAYYSAVGLEEERAEKGGACTSRHGIDTSFFVS